MHAGEGPEGGALLAMVAVMVIAFQ